MKRDWLQIISNAAIIVGFAVVIYELNQNRQHARAQMLQNDYAEILAHQHTLMGENPAEAIALAMSRPEELSDQQKLVVDAHLRIVFIRLDATKFVADVTGVIDKEDAMEGAPRALKTYFHYEYARDWWGRERKMPRPWAKELVDMFDKELGFVE